MNQRTIYYGSIGTALFLSSGMLIASVNSYANEATTPGFIIPPNYFIKITILTEKPANRCS
jgi:hypothetical protein